MKLDMKLAECFRELNAGDWNEAHVALYAKYFDMNVETVDGVEKKTYSYKEKALEDAESHYAGYLAIVTDQVDLTRIRWISPAARFWRFTGPRMLWKRHSMI